MAKKKQKRKPRLTPTEQERFFVDELIQGNFDRVRAALLAYPNISSRKKASDMAGKVLKRPAVKKLLRKKRELMKRRHKGLKEKDIYRIESNIASHDPTYLQDDDGSFITDVRKLPPQIRMAIKKIKPHVVKMPVPLKDPETGETVKDENGEPVTVLEERVDIEYELFDRGHALSRLEKILGMNQPDRLQVDVKDHSRELFDSDEDRDLVHDGITEVMKALISQKASNAEAKDPDTDSQ